MKMMILAPRRSGMTHGDFRRYLLEVHGPLVRSIAEVAADIRHYHYNFRRLGATDAAFGHPLADLDVVTQGFFDSREAQQANMQHQRFKDVLRPDESNFADTSRALMHYTDEHEVISGATTSAKVFYMRRRLPGMSRPEFQDRWRAAFPIALRSSPLNDVVQRYVQNHVQSEDVHPHGSDAKYYDVIDEFWLSSAAGFDALGATDSSAMEAVASTERELLDVGRTRAHIADFIASIP